MSRQLKIMNKLMLALIVLISAVLILGCSKGTSHEASVTSQPNQTQPAPAQKQSPRAERVPAHYMTAPPLDTLAPTLSPEMFSGNIRLAYEVAQKIPQTLAQLPCYCHCDMGHGHKSLQSCFVTEHGESCGICIGEALMAYQLEKQKVPVAEIRKRIIAAYGTSHSHQ
jgi:hypothetical protein